MKFLLGIIVILLSLASCSSFDKQLGKPLDLIYAEALSYLAKNDLIKAQEAFQRIVDEYPYKDEAIEAQIFLIWINYIKEDYVSAEVSIDAFLKYYSYNDYTPWVRYMQGLVSYEQILTKAGDLGNASNALVSFFELTKKDKESIYAKDAELKIQAIKYIMAQRIMDVGIYYLNNKNYIAAMSSYQEVAEYYQDTAFIEEALYRISYIWLTFGADDEAFKTVAVLGYNYPSSIWYMDALQLLNTYTKYDEDYKIKRQE